MIFFVDKFVGGGVHLRNMKKYTLVFVLALFITLSLGFNVNSVSAANCASGDLFNTTTGQPCGTTTTTVVKCPAGDLFSSVTGQRCTVWGDDSKDDSVDISLKRELKIGSRGDDVRELQRLLKELGILLGKIDGSYGPITANAVKKYQQHQSLPSTGQVDSKTIERVNTTPIPPGCYAEGPSQGVTPQRTTDHMVYVCPPTTPTERPTPVPTESSIKVLSPNGGEAWKKGTVQTIKWSDDTKTMCSLGACAQSGQLYEIMISSYDQSTSSSIIALVATGVEGPSYNWVVGERLRADYIYENNILSDGAYTIKVCQYGTTICDSSDSYFKIVSSGATQQSSITSFTATKIDSDGWYYKLSWTTTGANQVQLTQYPGVSGVSSTNDNGQDLSISNMFPSPGSVNVRFTNGYSYSTKASFILDPLPQNFTTLESLRKTITIDVPASGVAPVIASVAPLSGAIGTKVTISGNQFLPTGNDVAFVKESNSSEFDIIGLSSFDGKTLSFTVPNSTSVMGKDGITRTIYVDPGQYYLVVGNRNGKSDIFRGFTVTK